MLERDIATRRLKWRDQELAEQPFGSLYLEPLLEEEQPCAVPYAVVELQAYPCVAEHLLLLLQPKLLVVAGLRMLLVLGFPKVRVMMLLCTESKRGVGGALRRNMLMNVALRSGSCSFPLSLMQKVASCTM